MYRAALRRASRSAGPGLGAQRAQRAQALILRSAPHRFASTSPAHKSRSWRGSAFRWGLVGAATYYYCTSSIFASEEAISESLSKQLSTTAPSSFDDASESTQLPTVQSVIEQRKSQAAPKKQKAADASKPSSANDETDAGPETTSPAGDAEELEGEAGQQGAFNPETGEINWDCPCLGGMANGPCGEEFKEAFSCFVYSEEDPKGKDCIDKFQGMQDCFRQHPEVYGAELGDDDEEELNMPEGVAAEDSVTGGPQSLEGQHQEVPVEKKPTAAAEHKDQAAAEREKQAPSDDEPRQTAGTPAAAPEKKKKKNNNNNNNNNNKRDAKTAEPSDNAAPAATEKAKAPTAPSQRGPKWEDATGANVEPQAKPADKQNN